MGRGTFRERRRGRQQRRQGREKPPEPPRASIIVTAADGRGVLELYPSAYTINFDTDYLDATVFGDMNKSYLAGKKRVIIEADV